MDFWVVVMDTESCIRLAWLTLRGAPSLSVGACTSWGCWWSCPTKVRGPVPGFSMSPSCPWCWPEGGHGGTAVPGQAVCSRCVPWGLSVLLAWQHGSCTSPAGTAALYSGCAVPYPARPPRGPLLPSASMAEGRCRHRVAGSVLWDLSVPLPGRCLPGASALLAAPANLCLACWESWAGSHCPCVQPVAGLNVGFQQPRVCPTIRGGGRQTVQT